MAIRASKPYVAILAVIAALGLAPSAARAGVSAFGAGLAVPQPVGNASALLNHPASLQLDAWFEGFAAMGEYLRFQVTGRWEPYRVLPVANTNLHIFSFLGGLQLAGGPGFLGFTPFVSLQAGPVYESLSIGGVTSGINNNAWAFALQVAPGVDYTVYRHLGLSVSFPYEVILVRNPVPIWSSVFSVRWKL